MDGEEVEWLYLAAPIGVALRMAISRMQREVRSHAVAAIAAAVILGGCASVRQTVSGWFGEASPTATPVATSVATEQGQVYYAGVDGLTVYESASGSSKVVGRLALYEKVTRSRLDRGYAYVTAAKSGLEGWVDNAKLIWRIPSAAGAKPKEGEAATGESGEAGAKEAPETEAERAPAVEPPPTSTPEAEAVAPTPERAAPTPQAAAPAQQAQPPRPQPSIFDPF